MELCGTKKQEQLGFGYVEDACFSNSLFVWMGFAKYKDREIITKSIL